MTPPFLVPTESNKRNSHLALSGHRAPIPARVAPRLDVRLEQQGEEWMVSINGGKLILATDIEVELWRRLMEAGRA